MAKFTFKQLTWYWGPALFMVGCIVLESTDMMSGAHTSRYVIPFLHWLFPSVEMAQLLVVHGVLRKIGHVLGYGLLSALLFRAWWGTYRMRQSISAPNWLMRFAIFGALGAALVAISDELHQMTIPSRGGSVHDMVLDTSAAIAAQILIAYFLRRRAKLAVAS